MEDNQENVKKVTEFISKQKSSYQNNFQIEFEDFVCFTHDGVGEQEFDDELCDDPDLTTGDTKDLAYTEEEYNVINACKDPELKKLLILNRSKSMQLMKLHKKFQKLIVACDEELEEKRPLLKCDTTKPLIHRTFVWKLAAPYFKDKKFFPCPLNADAVRKRARNELSVYDLVPSPKWTPIEFDRLTNAVKCNYNINRQNAIMAKISTLKIKIEREESDDSPLVEQMIELKAELEIVKLDKNMPPQNSNKNIDWYKVSDTFLKDKHTPLECQSVWHLLVHPDINKSEWSEEENTSLMAIAKTHSYQNWDDIADELNYNRTGFTTCLHYFSKLCDKFKKSKFSPEEDAFLLDAVNMHKIGRFIPWNKVVCHFNDRSRHQLYHRYTYFLSQLHVKKGKFAEAEDILLMVLVNRFGRNFKKCVEYMPHRSQIQLKSRYNSNLQRQIKKGTFTFEDDEIIYNHARKHGEKNWSELATRLKRCNAQIRQRYKLIKTFLKENPNSTIVNIPKRKHRYDELGEGQHNFLNYVAEQYKDLDCVPTLSMIEESLQVTQRKEQFNIDTTESSEMKLKSIDCMLTDIFSSSMKVKHNTITEGNLNEAVETTQEILTSLGVKLDVPKELESSLYLDSIDLEILERLSQKTITTQLEVRPKLIPPNSSTLIGVRNMIIKHKASKSKQKHAASSSTSNFNSGENLQKISDDQKKEILFHREQFSKRFDALFNWSAILSLQKPNVNPAPEQSVVPVQEVPSSSASVDTKRPKPSDHTIVKRRKIDVSALANLKTHPQLKLVDKNVLEKFMKTNGNVIRLESVPRIITEANRRTSQSQTRVVHIDRLSHDLSEEIGTT